MIYTLTLNPSLDYFVTLDDFKPGRTNRTLTESMMPGGKGLNVSVVLHHLGLETTALGFVAGFTGEEIDRRVREMGVRSEFVRVKGGYSRINMKFKDFDGTEINGMGPVIDQGTLEQLLTRLDSLNAGDTLVLAGSIPGSIPKSVYRDICSRLADRGIRFVVDATRELLLNVLEFRPFLIKPNHHELGELFEAKIRSREEVLPYAEKLQQMGALNVLVSLAGEGAVLLDGTGKVHSLPAPAGQLINAVGAGDSMVAGFLAGYMKTGDYESAFRMGVAAGSATAFSELLADADKIEEVLRQI